MILIFNYKVEKTGIYVFLLIKNNDKSFL